VNFHVSQKLEDCSAPLAAMFASQQELELFTAGGQVKILTKGQHENVGRHCPALLARRAGHDDAATLLGKRRNSSRKAALHHDLGLTQAGFSSTMNKQRTSRCI
jgi:hypothetical protein